MLLHSLYRTSGFEAFGQNYQDIYKKAWVDTSTGLRGDEEADILAAIDKDYAAAFASESARTRVDDGIEHGAAVRVSGGAVARGERLIGRPLLKLCPSPVG